MNIHISSHDGVPIYLQIVNQVKFLLASGRLAPGEEIPPIRVLAEQLVINPNTVSRAYGELVREGVIEARPGRGMFVSRRRQIYSAPERARRMEQAVTSLISEGFMLGFTPEQIIEEVASRTQAHAPSKAIRSNPKGGSR